jgi:hypothetical protein
MSIGKLLYHRRLELNTQDSKEDLLLCQEMRYPSRRSGSYQQAERLTQVLSLSPPQYQECQRQCQEEYKPIQGRRRSSGAIGGGGGYGDDDDDEPKNYRHPGGGGSSISSCGRLQRDTSSDKDRSKTGGGAPPRGGKGGRGPVPPDGGFGGFTQGLTNELNASAKPGHQGFQEVSKECRMTQPSRGSSGPTRGTTTRGSW